MSKDNFRWEGHDRYVTSLKELREGSTTVLLYREGKSHHGIGKLKQIERLGARMVNQAFLDELTELEGLVELKLETISASDLSPISQLKNLRILRLANVSKISNFEAVLNLPCLEGLYIENAQHLHALDFLGGLQHIRRLGVEGGMYNIRRIASLAPLAKLKALEELYMSSISLDDKVLSYLTHLPRLKTLNCARFAPKSEFDTLRSWMPYLECSWCDEYKITV
jgi:Leucine-rich repeat (LRR) protein